MKSVAYYLCEYFCIDKSRFNKIFKYSSILSLIYFSALFLNISPYLDDYNWISNGTSFSHNLGRPLVNKIFSLFSFEYSLNENPFLLNIQPGYQILGVLLLVLSLTVFVLKLCESEESNYLILLVVSFMANPFLLQNYSYSMVGLTMACSYSIALLTSLKTKGNFTNLVIGSLLMFVSLCIYQISLNIFIGATILLFLVGFTEDLKKSFIFLFENIFKSLIAVTLYKILASDHIRMTNNSYMTHYGHLQNSFHGYMTNFINFSNTIFDVYGELRILTFFTLISILAFAIRYIFFSNNNKTVLNGIVFISACFLLFLFSFGIQVLLKNPVYQARTLAGFSIPLLATFYMYLFSFGKWFPSSKIVMALPIICFFLLSYKYADVRQIENRHNYHIGSSIVNDLNQLHLNNAAEIYSDGYRGARNDILQKLCDRNRILNFLSIGTLQEWYLNSYLRYHFNIPYRIRNFPTKKIKKALCTNTTKIINYSRHYIIAQKDRQIIIALNRGECFSVLQKKINEARRQDHIKQRTK